MKQVHIRLKFKGDTNKINYDILEIKKIIQDRFCSRLPLNIFKLVILKKEVIPQNHTSKICIFDILLRFELLANRPFTYNYQKDVDIALSPLKGDFIWISKGVVKFSASFSHLLNSLSPKELKLLYILSSISESYSTEYSSNYISIRKRAFDNQLILNHYSKVIS